LERAARSIGRHAKTPAAAPANELPDANPIEAVLIAITLSALLNRTLGRGEKRVSE
jgi:hypothetical protein